MSCVILNPNYTSEEAGGKLALEGKGEHSIWVWENIVDKADNVFVIAHSAGGYCMTRVIMELYDSCINKIKYLAFTDAVV